MNVIYPLELVHTYIHRWQIEQAFRVGKAELGIESPGCDSAGPPERENRMKPLAIVALVHDFLLSLLSDWSHRIPLFLNRWVPRTGNRHRSTSVPIYRLRLAIANALMVTLALVQIRDDSCLQESS